MSSSPLVECVPNFSEGRDRSIIDRIAAALGSVEGATVLDVDPGRATHRTVMTVVGSPQSVVEAAFRAIREAKGLIDMRRHRGAHARLGATDVCPFVPVSGVTMAECVALAESLGRRVGDELGIPVYLYESAARSPQRRNLADIRAGEYEGLAAKLADPAWVPDFGPSRFDASAGATVIGARKFLIAYNVNINSRSKTLANEIALSIREQGRNLRGPDGKFVLDDAGEPKKGPGRLRNCKAVGWYIEEYSRAQVSINLTDSDVTSLHHAFDACEEEATKLGVRLTGSELVGLVPLNAMLEAGRHYLRRQQQSTAVSEARLVEAAITSLGLSELSPFDPRTKIIEYRIGSQASKLSALTVAGFADELASESPAPGGGSVAALLGSLSGALTSMVGNLTVGKKGLTKVWEEAEALAVRGQGLKAWFLAAIDADTNAFNDLMTAFRIPTTDPQRASALEAAQWRAIQVPRSVVDKTVEAVEIADRMLSIGNPNAASDAACAAICAAAAAECSAFNVFINLRELPTSDRTDTMRRETMATLALVQQRARQVATRFVTPA